MQSKNSIKNPGTPYVFMHITEYVCRKPGCGWAYVVIIAYSDFIGAVCVHV